MKYMLDTDICIHLIRKRAIVLQELSRRTPEEVGISVITLAELVYGAKKSRDPERNLEALDQFTEPLEVAPFDTIASGTYGGVRATLEAMGLPIGALDTLIGAHALSLGATLVTHNTREFSRIKGLRLVDWLSGPVSRA